MDFLGKVALMVMIGLILITLDNYELRIKKLEKIFLILESKQNVG